MNLKCQAPYLILSYLALSHLVSPHLVFLLSYLILSCLTLPYHILPLLTLLYLILSHRTLTYFHYISLCGGNQVHMLVTTRLCPVCLIRAQSKIETGSILQRYKHQSTTALTSKWQQIIKPSETANIFFSYMLFQTLFSKADALLIVTHPVPTSTSSWQQTWWRPWHSPTPNRLPNNDQLRENRQHVFCKYVSESHYTSRCFPCSNYPQISTQYNYSWSSSLTS